MSLPAMTGENPVFVLFDLFGRPLVTQTLTGFDTPIDTKRLPAGMYGWQMRYRGVVAQAGKVVKR
ncbi:MAG: T9SS type A sorting domain-containing protein [Lewinellaceae bacterium]|nr:T9SS type A sorting domain-containing protein [Lewinellaceae bacterium]